MENKLTLKLEQHNYTLGYISKTMSHFFVIRIMTHTSTMSYSYFFAINIDTFINYFKTVKEIKIWIKNTLYGCNVRFLLGASFQQYCTLFLIALFAF